MSTEAEKPKEFSICEFVIEFVAAGYEKDRQRKEAEAELTKQFGPRWKN